MHDVKHQVNIMNKMKLVLKFMEILYAGQNLEELAPLLSKDFTFQGPLFQCNSAEEYIRVLKSDPPVGFKYNLIESYQNSNSVALFFLFSKPGIKVPMAQLFEIRNDKICKIYLIFDSKAFTE